MESTSLICWMLPPCYEQGGHFKSHFERQALLDAVAAEVMS